MVMLSLHVPELPESASRSATTGALWSSSRAADSKAARPIERMAVPGVVVQAAGKVADAGEDGAAETPLSPEECSTVPVAPAAATSELGREEVQQGAVREEVQEVAVREEVEEGTVREEVQEVDVRVEVQEVPLLTSEPGPVPASGTQPASQGSHPAVSSTNEALHSAAGQQAPLQAVPVEPPAPPAAPVELPAAPAAPDEPPAPPPVPDKPPVSVAAPSAASGRVSTWTTGKRIHLQVCAIHEALGPLVKLPLVVLFRLRVASELMAEARVRTCRGTRETVL